MSAKKVKIDVYECRCELLDCCGKGQPWFSRDENIPDRCTHCGRRTWNHVDKRYMNLVTVNGNTKRISEWARLSGLDSRTIRARLKAGWTPEKSVLYGSKLKGEML